MTVSPLHGLVPFLRELPFFFFHGISLTFLDLFCNLFRPADQLIHSVDSSAACVHFFQKRTTAFSEMFYQCFIVPCLNKSFRVRDFRLIASDLMQVVTQTPEPVVHVHSSRSFLLVL